MKCDQCGEIAVGAGHTTWLHLERADTPSRAAAWDFCSWLCVAEYAVKRGTSVTLHGPSTAELAGRMATELYDALQKVL